MVAKRVRSETALGSGTVSVSSVAVDLARRIFGDLSEHAILLVGAGEMAEAAARSLGKGAKSIRVCNRSFERAAQLAAQFGGAAAPLEQLESELLISDVVVVSTGSRSYVVTKEMVKRVMKARKGRTLFFVDISVPRNVEPEVHGIDNVYVFNVDDLEDQVRQGLRARHAEVAQAEAIVEAEVGSFGAWVRALDVQPTIVALRGRTRGVLVAELERTLAGKLKHLPEADRAALLQMVDSATNKLLHGPTTQLKAGGEGQGELLRAVQTLFELPTRSDRAAADARADEAQDPEAPAERVTH
jgi:glutamyl-tRNA reductase